MQLRFPLTAMYISLLVFEVKAASIFSAFTSSVGNLFREQEEAPYSLVRKTQDFEERQYGPLKWVCSKETNIKESSSQQTNTFLQLFSYLERENSADTNMDMAIPVSIQYRNENSSTPQLSACFFIGHKYQNNPPTPRNLDLTITEREPMTIYTRKFGGFADTPSEWLEEAKALMQVLSRNGITVRKDLMYWNAFDSPVKFWSRRNEVWLLKA